MNDAQKLQIGTLFYQALIIIIPAGAALLVGVMGWMLSEVKRNAQRGIETHALAEDTAASLAELKDGKGVEKIVEVITAQQAQGKIPPGTVPQAVTNPVKTAVMLPVNTKQEDINDDENNNENTA